MSAPDPSLLVQPDVVVLRMALVDALDGDHPTAIVFQRIHWRCERGPWTATREQIMAETRLSEWLVKKAISRLTSMGWIKVERTDRFNATNTYSLPPEWKAASRSERQAPSHSEREAPSRSTVLEDSRDKRDTPSDSPGRVEVPDVGFEEWWDTYAHKRNKPAALRAYRAARKKVSAEVLLEGARRAVRSRGPEPRYWPHPSTWLNGERWADEAPSNSVGSPGGLYGHYLTGDQ